MEVVTLPKHLSSKKGVTGTPVTLKANFFELKTFPDWKLYHYHVTFTPEEDNNSVRKALLRMHKDMLGGYIFDGTTIFTSRRLVEHESCTLQLHSTRSMDNEKVLMTLREVGDLAMGDAHYTQFFNILMRKCLGYLNLQLVGRNFYDPNAKIKIPEMCMELWPGYILSIRQHENQILMSTEVSHKIMRTDTVYKLLKESARVNAETWQGEVKKAIIGSVVLTDYNNRTYRIDDIDFRASPNSTFKLKSGSDITYREYYWQKYDINICDADQPLLISYTKARERRAGMGELVYLVPELCRMTGLTEEMRKDFHLMRELAEHTRVGPYQRIQKLQEFAKRLTDVDNVARELDDWNMKFSQQLVEFKGRVLPPEKIIQGYNVKYEPSAPGDWTRDMRSKCMLTHRPLSNWVVLTPSKCLADAKYFVNTLQQASRGMQYVIQPPLFYDIHDDRSGTYVQQLERIINMHNPDLIMCVVPNNRTERYSAIKKKCCVERDVPTQVIVAKTMKSKGVMSIATKVAIQINCKLGGAPWSVDIPLSGLMVAGFDVCHQTARKGTSYGAFVASLDKPMTRYFSAVSVHGSGEELSNDLSINMIKAVKKYQEYNQGNLPQRIIFYRDGVGEGQIPYVLNHEVELIEEKLAEVYSQIGAKPRLAFIVVTKRINTRLFMDNMNPPPGTVVDDCVTLPQRYDFYIVSQSVRQGTVSPTAYHVIHDNVGLEPDKIQRLTYKLTHLYYNWSGTVRVPAPCQYAHKLAYLAGQALQQRPHNMLNELLYFL